MMRFVTLLLLAAALMGERAEALYTSSGPVKVLTKANFGPEVLGSDTPYIVEFYAPWCGHCKQLAPAYTAVASKVEGLVGVGAIDCDQERELCGAYGIKGFPTLKVFPGERTTKGGKPWKEPVDYNGARSTAAIASAGLAQLTDKHVQVVSKAADLAKVLEANKGKTAVLFSAKAQPANLFKALSMQLKPRGLNFVLVPEKGNADIAKNTYHVAQFPTLLVAGGDGAPVPFQGKLGYSALLAFLEPHAQPRAKREAPPQEPAPTAKPVEYDQVMEEITDAALWDSKCANKSGLCGIAFLDPLDDETRHAKFVATLQETLKAVYRNVRIMWVDAAKHPAFTAHFKLGGGFPNFAIYTPSKKRVVPYVGAFATADLVEWIDKKVLSGAGTKSLSVEPPTFA